MTRFTAWQSAARRGFATSAWLAVPFRFVLDIVREAVEAARAAGAAYADARFVSEESESLTVKNQEMEGIDRSLSQGVGIRVLVDGTGGSRPPLARTVRDRTHGRARRRDRAGASARLPAERVTLADVEPAYEHQLGDQVVEDPFMVALDEKVGLLMAARRPAAERERRRRSPSRRSTSTGAARTSPRARGRRSSRPSSTPGAGSRRPRSPTARCSAGRSRTRSAGTSARRATSTSARSACSRTPSASASEAVELLSAPDCPGEVDDARPRTRTGGPPDPRVGRPPGRARPGPWHGGGYAGTSFVRPSDRGRLRYGSDVVTIDADATLPGGLGTFGLRRRGRRRRSARCVIEDGIFQNFIEPRHGAAHRPAARSGACAPTAGRTCRSSG